ncbi:MAG: hypothetical protein Q8M11_09460 [Sulfuritalea sp.]|nr:hypothetical protein [Sulfuritalea sp.]MDP1984011.1 hypothetical protein [Sulfuritalea sp.]
MSAISAACRRSSKLIGLALWIFVQSACATPPYPHPLRGQTLDRAQFRNPHAHIPAQCYIETSQGTQNPCLFCHTDGVWKAKLGNNNPQAGANPNVGNLQAEYAFASFNLPFTPNASINPWRNTLRPELLRAELARRGIDPARWDMAAWLGADNWRAAYAQRPRKTSDWDSGVEHPLRLFPALNPADLPARDDGFVRSPTKGLWNDGQGWNTGWRAVNFMPYGIFTPQAGSVSGIYLRLPQAFMKNAAGRFDLATYTANLDLLARHIQDRARADDPPHYLGAAKTVGRVRGQYPLGTEFAHPLHYVDVTQDGARAARVKEIRWMMKQHPWHADEFNLGLKEENAPVYAHPRQGWIENGVGWLLAGWIEDAKGKLRAQTPSELVQCVGCHSGNVRQSDIGNEPEFTSGTGNTIDSTWAFPRQLAGAAGWREMDYLGYRAATKTLTTPEPKNRGHGKGEFAFFLDHVVGASLYGDMPASMERVFAAEIPGWPALDTHSADRLIAAQEKRQQLMRGFTARKGHLDTQGRIRVELFIPPLRDALEAARRYRMVVATQSYDFGKDVFPATPLAFRYFRRAQDAFTHQDGRPYALGEVIADRPVNNDPGDLSYGMGIIPTLIEGGGVPDYLPLLE